MWACSGSHSRHSRPAHGLPAGRRTAHVRGRRCSTGTSAPCRRHSPTRSWLPPASPPPPVHQSLHGEKGASLLLHLSLFASDYQSVMPALLHQCINLCAGKRKPIPLPLTTRFCAGISARHTLQEDLSQCQCRYTLRLCLCKHSFCKKTCCNRAALPGPCSSTCRRQGGGHTGSQRPRPAAQSVVAGHPSCQATLPTPQYAAARHSPVPTGHPPHPRAVPFWCSLSPVPAGHPPHPRAVSFWCSLPLVCALPESTA